MSFWNKKTEEPASKQDDVLDDLIVDKIPARKSDALWEEARRLDKEYTSAYNKVRNQLKKGKDYQDLSSTVADLKTQLLDAKRRLRHFVSDRKPQELEELNQKRAEAWRISQEETNKEWEEEKKLREEQKEVIE